MKNLKRQRFYVLDGLDVVPLKPDDVIVWSMGLDYKFNSIRQDNVGKDVMVSTVFLGIDYGSDGIPLVFETAVFGGASDRTIFRYPTYADALSGHRSIVECLRNSEPANPMTYRQEVTKEELEEELVCRTNMKKLYHPLQSGTDSLF